MFARRGRGTGLVSHSAVAPGAWNRHPAGWNVDRRRQDEPEGKNGRVCVVVLGDKHGKNSGSVIAQICCVAMTINGG